MVDPRTEGQQPVVAIHPKDAEELVAIAHATDLLNAKVQLLPSGDVAELDSIRELRRIVLDTMADSAEYRSGT